MKKMCGQQANIIRAFAQEPREVARFGRENERTFEENYRIRRLIALEVSLVSVLNALGLVFVMWAGVKYVAAGQMTAGSLVSFLAYLALGKIGQPQAGETVVVAAASGAVGSLAGQIAKLRGCRTVVLAGAADKRRFATEDTAFDACIERRAPDLGARLRVACPNGIDVYFENAGGAVFNTVLPLLNEGARVPLRGTIGGRDGADSSEKAVRLRYLARWLAAKRIKMQAFIVSDHRHRYGEFVQQMSHWLDSGKAKFREDIVDGLENAPRAFIGVLEGRRFGKLVIRVANQY